MIPVAKILHACRAACFVLTVAAAIAGQALAHATLIASDPPDGVVFETAPADVTLRFNEAVEPTAIRLLSPDGRSVDLVDVAKQGTTLLLRPPVNLSAGTYVVSWRVVSEDGHPISGAFIFSVGRPSASAPAMESVNTPIAVRGALWFARFLLVIGAAFGVGGIAFTHLLARRQASLPQVDALIKGALIAGSLGAVASIALQGLDLRGGSFDALVDPVIWKAGLFTTGFGATAAIASLAFALAGVARATPSTRAAMTFSVLALLLVGGAFAASGHAATAAPQWLTRPAVFAHAVAVTFWIGALLPLAALLRRKDVGAPAALKRFSDLISFGLLALFTSGLALSIIQLGSVSALWRTDYGQILSIKLLLIAAILTLAGANRFLFTKSAIAEEERGQTALVRSVAAETALAFLTLGIVGLWRFTPPPRSLASTASVAGADHVDIRAGDLTARLTVQPPRVGPIAISLDEFRLKNATIAPLSISLSLEKPSFGLGPFQKDMARTAEGRFVATNIFLPMDGFWVVRVDVLVTEFHKISMTDIVSLRP